MTERVSSEFISPPRTGIFSAADRQREWRIRQLIAHLPPGMQRTIQWMRRPSARWARLPAGVGFCIGGVFAVLPVLGLWMLPLGLVLLSEDIPALRRLTDKALDWLEGRIPHWFNHDKVP
jgi:hypothetical protein